MSSISSNRPVKESDQLSLEQLQKIKSSLEPKVKISGRIYKKLDAGLDKINRLIFKDEHQFITRQQNAYNKLERHIQYFKDSYKNLESDLSEALANIQLAQKRPKNPNGIDTVAYWQNKIDNTIARFNALNKTLLDQRETINTIFDKLPNKVVDKQSLPGTRQKEFINLIQQYQDKTQKLPPEKSTVKNVQSKNVTNDSEIDLP